VTALFQAPKVPIYPPLSVSAVTSVPPAEAGSLRSICLGTRRSITPIRAKAERLGDPDRAVLPSSEAETARHPSPLTASTERAPSH